MDVLQVTDADLAEIDKTVKLVPYKGSSYTVIHTYRPNSIRFKIRMFWWRHEYKIKNKIWKRFLEGVRRYRRVQYRNRGWN